MTNSNSQKAANYFQSEGLRAIFSKIRALETLSKKISTYLEPSLAEKYHVANLIENKLVLIVANASIATQLRYQTPDLLKQFKQDLSLHHIQDIQCKVRPHQYTPSRLRPKNKSIEPLSAKASLAVREIAQSLNDPKLREILERIASHTKESQER